MTESLIHIREMTGFNKVGYLAEDTSYTKPLTDGFDVFLPENGFELVYKGNFPYDTVDFSSYFAAAEAAGVEMLIPIIYADGGILFCKEYYDRQSPMVVYGSNSLASNPNSWEWTDGKCNHMSLGGIFPTAAGYSFTSKTLQTRDAYMDRWSEDIDGSASNYYDVIKFILVDAIERAGTIDTDAVIEALEETSVETSNARDFVFTPSHAVMVGKDPNDPDADYPIAMVFQWQNGVQVPICPKKIMDEAGTSYTFPDWPGPWD
jgi:branched-chain amino acid transport system substrate-binding protein